jgi:nucleoside-diphosphate-sugar epimerase
MIKGNQSNLPVIIISGASGFIGRYFLEFLRNKYFIYALARRSQKAADIPNHKNINWIRVDIANEPEIKRVILDISNNGGADYFLHLAGFFDFHNLHHPEYRRTNVQGMKYILEVCDNLKLKRFIFSSSLAILDFSNPSRIINEDSLADATYPYAVTKREGEEMLKEFSSFFPCTIIRLAAMFSDWCEHKPLYSLLSTWLSPNWDHRILGGKGESAIPYLHIYDLINMFKRIIAMTEQLPNYHILNASPGYSVSHKELFKIACKYNYFRPVKAIYTKKWFATFGVILKNIMGTAFGKRPFERLWMMKYIDKKLIVDSTHTRTLLNWEPVKRYNIKRRLLFMIAKMKSNPHDWHYRNAMRPSYAITERQYIKIYETMLKLKEQIIRDIHKQLIDKHNSDRLSHYQAMPVEARAHCVEYIFKILEMDIRTGDRSHILEYAEHLAEHRFLEKFPLKEVLAAISLTSDTITRALMSQPELRDMRQRIFDEIMLSFQLMKDEVEDTYMYLSSNNK